LNMKKPLTIFFAAASMLTTTLSIGQMGMGMGGPGMMMGRPAGGMSVQRHQYVRVNGIDPRYSTARNPLVASAENIKAGKIIYEQNCFACHGTTGQGDGPASKGLNPAPANLAAALKMPIASDAYLDWTISEGGVPLHSPMPPFKTALTSDQIWKLVFYLRTL
jgi:mono/diheme cytochrome c family protein